MRRPSNAGRGLPVLAAALAALAAAPAWGQAAQRPDFSGIWGGGRYGVQANIPFDAYEFTPAGRAANERNTAGVEAHDPVIDTALACLPTGPTRAMVGLPFVVSHTDRFLVLAPESDPLARVIYIDAEHRPDYWPTYNGDSVARWEGDTLVVETVKVLGSTFLDMRGLPHTEDMRIVERIRLTGPDELENQITIHDPEYYVRPFSFTRRFLRDDQTKPVENVCENSRDHPSQPND